MGVMLERQQLPSALRGYIEGVFSSSMAVFSLIEAVFSCSMDFDPTNHISQNKIGPYLGICALWTLVGIPCGCRIDCLACNTSCSQ